LAAAVTLLACIYTFVIGKQFAASLFAARPELSKLQLAVRLAPGNADYRHRLGRYFAFVAGDPQSAIENFRAAVALNPHDAHYWFDLAGAYQVTGDTPGQRTALDSALQAEPTAPDVAWEAANFFIVDGDIDRALRELHVGKGVIERDIEGKYPDLKTELVLYCGGGFRSALAADNLQKMGYTNVISMDGGFRDWREKGFSLEK